jgi:hypothetical protein
MTLAWTLRGAHAQEAIDGAPFHEWTFPDGSLAARFYRLGGGYLLRFPGLADFEISAALDVACVPAPRVARTTCEHVYLNQVLPLVLARRGKLVFHASAVDVDAAALAFVGASGRGKSTLAAAFAAAGARVLADDGLVLEAAGGGYRALPGHPSLRLWDDSRAALLPPDARSAPPLPHTDKARFLAGTGLAFGADARPLARAYFLGEGGAAQTVIAPMRGSEAAVEWVRHSFLLDLEERSVLAAQFDRVAGLADHVRCYRLDYPRRYEELRRVREAIVAQLHEEAAPA